MNNSKPMWKDLEPIAQKHFETETLETRNSDRLDFHEVAVWSIRDALAAAYEAGHLQGRIDSAKKRTEAE